jgi:Glyoxalase/Bleomycin resistance protein/Dioxygenase superfamily
MEGFAGDSINGGIPEFRFLIFTIQNLTEMPHSSYESATEDAMDHLLNWVEIPVANMKRAMSFYRELLGIDVHEMKLGNN